MSQDLTIMPFDLRFRTGAAALWCASAASAGLATYDTTTVQDLDRRIGEELRDGWSAFLAWRGETLVAFLALKPADARLHELFVAPQAQGQGIGARMLAFAKQQLPDGFWLHTAADNAGARRFYERHGLTLCKTYHHPKHSGAMVKYQWP